MRVRDDRKLRVSVNRIFETNNLPIKKAKKDFINILIYVIRESKMTNQEVGN